MSNTAIKVENLVKEYRLGVIGAGTLREDIQSAFARFKGAENPNSKIGREQSIAQATRFKALDDVSFEVKKGDALAIIGGNGAGKSTLLKLISQITAPTKGRILINGKISSMLEVGTGFHRELTGRENIYMNGAILGMSKNDIDLRLDEIIEFSGVSQFIDTPVKRYSSGMFVRLAFAVAAHLNSDILILDEVLAVGDESFKQKSLGKMSEISQQEGKTILYVSHSMSTVKRLCTRAIVLDSGRIVFDGDTDGGIAEYMNRCSNAFASANVELTKAQRGRYLAQRVQMQQLCVEEKNNAVFEKGEKCNLVIKWRALEKVENALLRVVIKSPDKTPVGMCISDALLNAAADTDNETALTLDFSQLCAGKYYCDISISQKSGVGRFDNLDRVENAFFFEYAGSERASDTLWQPSVWGNTVLPKIVIK